MHPSWQEYTPGGSDAGRTAWSPKPARRAVYADASDGKKWERLRWGTRPTWGNCTGHGGFAGPAHQYEEEEYQIAEGPAGLPEEEAGPDCIGRGILQIQKFLMSCKLLAPEAARADGGGYFGEETYAALIQFQKARKVHQSSWGYYDGDTFDAMMDFYEEVKARHEAQRAAAVQEHQLEALRRTAATVATHAACSGAYDSMMHHGGDEVPAGRAHKAMINLNMPKGYTVTATVDDEVVEWGGREAVSVFEPGDHTISDLVVEHEQFGWVRWNGELRFTESFTLADAVVLGAGEISICNNGDKPPRGESVNRRAVACLHSVRPTAGYSARAFEDKLRDIAATSGEFISYDAKTGEWAFTIDEL